MRKGVKVRAWTQADIPGIVELQKAAYSEFSVALLNNARLYEMQFGAFPEGQVLAELGSKIIGYATSMIVQLNEETHQYTYGEITGSSTFSTHNPGGDTLYGADIAVHPDYRGHGVAGKLYEYRKKIIRKYNLRRMLAFGRIPGYMHYAGKLSPEEYVERVVRGDLKDPALNAHLKAGYTVSKVILDLITDKTSLNYSTIIEMSNPNFKPEKRRIAAPPLKTPLRTIRVCAAQYLMREIESWDDIERSVRFFVDTAESYFCHFILFPELFTTQLFSIMPVEWNSRRAAQELASFTDRYIDMFKLLAQKNNIYVIGGSHPVVTDGEIFNVAHLFTPSGNVYTQEKLHITPGERRSMGIQPGNSIKVFDTPWGRIAIQVCYDIEFPEISRLLALAGTEVIFVPFSTDERKAYNRVRFTAQARAVENSVFVVIAGNVGNLSTEKILLNYGQAAILTPSDFGFPPESTLGQAEPNLETVVIADLDLAILRQQREMGTIRPLFDRRPDIYELKMNIPITVVPVE